MRSTSRFAITTKVAPRSTVPEMIGRSFVPMDSSACSPMPWMPKIDSVKEQFHAVKIGVGRFYNVINPRRSPSMTIPTRVFTFIF